MANYNLITIHIVLYNGWWLPNMITTHKPLMWTSLWYTSKRTHYSSFSLRGRKCFATLVTFMPQTMWFVNLTGSRISQKHLLMCITKALCFQRDTIDCGKRYVSYRFLSWLKKIADVVETQQHRHRETTKSKSSNCWSSLWLTAYSRLAIYKFDTRRSVGKHSGESIARQSFLPVSRTRWIKMRR